MKYGLSSAIISDIVAIFSKHPKIEKVVLYGSRAKGTYQEGSDIDLTLMGDDLELTDSYAVDDDLDSLNLPYTIDLSLYKQITNKGLIGHIERRGEVFYRKANSQFIQTKLSECCKIKPSKSEAKKAISESDLVSFVPMKNLGIDTKDLLLDSERKLSEVSGSYTYFSDNDVLLAKITPCFENGKLGIAKELKNGIGFGSSEFIVFRPGKKLLPEYLYYFLLRPSFRDDGKKVMTGAVGHKRIPKDFIENTEIPLPFINEQKRIVAILDLAFIEIEKARANAEQNLKNARELFESYLQQVFSQRGDGWVEKELGGVCDFLNGYAFKSRDSIDYSDTQLVRMGNLYQNTLSLDRKPVFYPSNHANEYKKFSLVEGDLVMSLTGTVGKKDYGFTVEIPRFSGNLLLNQRIVKFIDIDKRIIGKSFLLRILRSGLFLDKLYESANGTRQANLSTVTMTKLKILLPKLSVQEDLIITFDKLELEIERLEKNYKTKIASLHELKKSILQKAFTGELTKEITT